MTEGESAILHEISESRKAFAKGLAEARADIRRVHLRIDVTDTEVAKIKETVLVSKTRIGTFVAGMVFVFTGIGALVSHYVKSKF